MVRHDSGVDLLLAPPTPESAELVSAEQHHLPHIVDLLRTMYDYVIVDLDKRLDDHMLDVIGAADKLFVVMTADLSCIKNVRLVLETMGRWAWPTNACTCAQPRNAFTGISVKSVESVLKRRSRSRWSTTTGRRSPRSTAASRSWSAGRTRQSGGECWSWRGWSTSKRLRRSRVDDLSWWLHAPDADAALQTAPRVRRSRQRSDKPALTGRQPPTF